jgi:ribosome-binding ATPase YchF (GTP1/OBG family)
MKIALIGFPLSGKTTLFHTLCEGHAHEGYASVPVPDARLERIIELAKPKKVTPTAMEWHDDLPELIPDKPETVRGTLTVARQLECLVCVLRLFDTPYAPYHADISPLRDLRFWMEECLLTDLQTVENRLGRLGKLFKIHKESAADRAEAQVLERMKVVLETGTPLRELEDLPNDMAMRMRGFELLSAKPVVALVNVSESLLGQEDSSEAYQELKPFCEAHSISLFSLCIPFERDLLELEPSERTEYLQMMSMSEPRLPAFVRCVYDQFEVNRFYTVGNDTRAWLLPKGGTAQEAAGIIHSDLARGFIRAEVCHFEDFVACGGWDAAHKAGKTRLEGREYRVQDGDVINIRFNV